MSDERDKNCSGGYGWVSLLHTFTGGFWEAVGGCSWVILILVVLFAILSGIRCG